jgi:putative aldouronate transport system substrate-binding protein
MKKRMIGLIVLAIMVSISLYAGGSKDAGVKGNGRMAEDIALRFLISSSFYDLESDLGWQTAERVAGYKIDFEVLNGTEQLMLIIASGEPYDYVYLTRNNYDLLLNEGALIDITDLLKQHGGNITNAITTLWPAVTVNSRIYAIPSTVAQPNALQTSIVYRKDLLDKAGISPASTAEEFYTMLKRLKAAYPDMIPLTAAGSYEHGGYFIPPITSAFGIRGLWQEENGAVVPIVKHPRIRAYIEYVRRLYAEDLLDKEMPALQYNAAQAKWTSGRAVMFHAGWNGIETPIGALRELQPQMRYDVFPLLKDEQGNIHAEARSGVGAYGGFPATSKHPAEAIKAVNNMIELKNFTEIALGVEGRHYSLKDGVYYPIQPAFNDEKINSNVFIAGFYREDVYPKMWESRLMKNDDLKYVFDAMKASLQGKGIKSPVALAPAVTVINNLGALNTYVRDNLIAIVAGTKPMSALDDLVRYWDANGGDKVTEFYNNWYYKK